MRASFSGITLFDWQDAYRMGAIQPHQLLELLDLNVNDPAWITRLDRERLSSQLEFLERRIDEVEGDLARLPLYGIPFAVKDNIDVEGWPTTAACPAFEYIAKSDAKVVAKLREAGAIVVGKTNLDQFATGLVGTRSPYGIVPNAFRAEYISGGSSSGSASVVSRGIVPFALGTDTAGSGRVPAGMNNIVGLKPTRGWLSTSGSVPACRTLDCIAILALTVEDARTIATLAAGFDASDPYSRTRTIDAPLALPDCPRFGMPQQPEFFRDAEAEKAFTRALQVFEEMGAELIAIDYSPFAALAPLLYEGPWVAERFAAVESLWKHNPEAIDPIVRSIVENAARFSAEDTFKFEYKRAQLTASIDRILATVDALVVPTVPTMYTIDEVLAAPIELNSQLGTYTNFANLADLCALSLPTGMREDGLPAGITLLAPAWRDLALVQFGIRWQRHSFRNGYDTRLGATQLDYPESTGDTYHAAEGSIRVAVVGAHLRGMPLNHQLVSRGAAFVEATRTAREYRLFALANSKPAKPALMHVNPGDAGECIEVELWDMPTGHFGAFTAEVQAPLGIGSVTLEDGRIVKGFICEPCGIQGAQEITAFGGWRAYLADLQQQTTTRG